MSMPNSEYLQVRGRIAWAALAPTLIACVVVATIICVFLGLSSAQVIRALLLVLLPNALFFACTLSGSSLWMTRRALETRPGDQAGERLQRILMLPRRVEMWVILLNWIPAATSFTAGTIIMFDGSLWNILIGPPVAVCTVLFIGPVTMCLVEESIRPAAIAEFLKSPGARGQHGGFLWIRQRWYLPYAFTTALLSLLFLDGLIVFAQIRTAADKFVIALTSDGTLAAADTFRKMLGELTGEILLPVGIITTILVTTFALTGYFLAKRQALAAEAVEASLRSVAARTPAAPEWVSTDETGDLAQAAALVVDEMTRALKRLDDMADRAQGASGKLHEIVVHLKAAAAQLSTATTQQVTAVTETAHTMTEMAQTSAASAERANELIKQGEAAAEVVQTGAAAAGDSSQAMVGIADTLHRVTEASLALAERARRIDSISETVGILADQSSTLAINASIEAAKAGEAGKGFGVVAREIRTLASDSRKAAQQIREIVGEIRQRTTDVDSAVGAGTKAVGNGKKLVDQFSGAISHLGDTIYSAVGIMRQVDGAARQHEEGVSQVSEALTSLQAAAEQIRDSARNLGDLSAEAHELAGIIQVDGREASPEAAPA